MLRERTTIKLVDGRPYLYTQQYYEAGYKELKLTGRTWQTPIEIGMRLEFQYAEYLVIHSTETGDLHVVKSPLHEGVPVEQKHVVILPVGTERVRHVIREHESELVVGYMELWGEELRKGLAEAEERLAYRDCMRATFVERVRNELGYKREERRHSQVDRCAGAHRSDNEQVAKNDARPDHLSSQASNSQRSALGLFGAVEILIKVAAKALRADARPSQRK